MDISHGESLRDLVLSVLASIGGGAIIVAGFAQWLGKLWAKRLIQDEKAKLDQELEGYKVRLRKSEFIFQKEYEAASELVAYIQSLLPEHYMPDMIWDDACESMALKLGVVETDLRKYLGTHGAILTAEAEGNIERCIYLAGSTKHKLIDAPDVPQAASDAASEIYLMLKKARESLIKQVRGQTAL